MTQAPIKVVGSVVWIETLSLVGYALMCLLCLLLIVYLRFNRREAFKGDIHASRKLILPAFEPLLWILAATTGIYVVFFSAAIQTDLYTVGFPNLDREFFYAGRQFVFVLVLMFLCQKSVSGPALRCAIAKSLLLSTYTLPIVCLFIRYAPQNLELLFFVKLVTRPLLLIFVVWVCMLHPPVGRANSHVIRMHGWFIVVYHVFLVVHNIVRQYAKGSVMYPILAYTILLWGSMCPLLIWQLLRADTEYWRGMGKRACSLQHVVRQSQPNSYTQPTAVVNEDISSYGLHVLIEVHRKFLIDFSQLELKRTISAGHDTVMYSGLLRSSRKVAVKVYTPRHFTEEVVTEFSYEAALCAALIHPNIVEFYGMCVCPPTICLVSELCQCTLEDALQVQRGGYQRRLAPRHDQSRGQHHGGDKGTSCGLDSQRIQLNVAYMLDCSRAVAYVHSFSPPFLHRDIKPANFLLDGDNTLKLTEFSDSRRLPSEVPISSVGANIDNMIATDAHLTSNPPRTLKPKMTVTGTVDYMAPEMIESRTGLATYAEAADVFSLAITFWDMLYPGREKYPDTNNNHLLVFEGVLGGSRPPLENGYDDAVNELVPPRLRDLIVSAWQKNPEARPTAQQVVNELEQIQEELLALLAQDLLGDFDTESGPCSPMPALQPFTGEHTVDRMEELKVIGSKSEGVRLGRALMDAGFLHHCEHTCGFRDSDKSLYVLDDDNINFCQPLAILEEIDGTSQSDDGPHAPPNYQLLSASSKPKLRKRELLLSHLTSTFSSSGQTGSESDSRSIGDECACRSLGQLQNVPITPVSSRHRRRRRRQTRARDSGCSSVCSGRSNFVSATTPKRWQPRRKNEPENSLRSKLLDEEEREHAINAALNVVDSSTLV